jgi:hypothetical protein
MEDENELERIAWNIMGDTNFNSNIQYDEVIALVSPLQKMKDHDVRLNLLCGKLLHSKHYTQASIKSLLHAISDACIKTIGSCNAIQEATRNIVSDSIIALTKEPSVPSKSIRYIEINSTQECPHFIPDATRLNEQGIEETYPECALVSGMECEVHSTIRGDSECKCEDPFPKNCPLDKKVK